MTVADFVTPAWTVDICVATSEAAHEMRKCKVNALVAMDGDIPVGIVTEDQVIAGPACTGLSPDDATVVDVMSRQAFRLRPADEVANAVRRMRSLEINLAPVVDCRGKLRGIFSIDSYLARSCSEELPSQAVCTQQGQQTPAL